MLLRLIPGLFGLSFSLWKSTETDKLPFAGPFPDTVPAVILVSACSLASWTGSSTWRQLRPLQHWPIQAVAAYSGEQEAAPSSCSSRHKRNKAPEDYLTLSGWQGNLNYTPKGCGLWKTRKNVSIVCVNCFVLQAGVNQHICSPYLSDPLHKSPFERMPLMWGGCLCKTQPPGPKFN